MNKRTITESQLREYVKRLVKEELEEQRKLAEAGYRQMGRQDFTGYQSPTDAERKEIARKTAEEQRALRAQDPEGYDAEQLNKELGQGRYGW